MGAFGHSDLLEEIRWNGHDPTDKPRWPSSAFASLHTQPNDVRTEDDILHLQTLPDFGGAFGQRDSELLLSYLTVPYIRIPLVLNFFATDDRVHALRVGSLQEILDSVLFEPAKFVPTLLDLDARMPQEVPTTNPVLLGTSYGLLLNELQRSPAAIIASITNLVRLALELDTGSAFATSRDVVLYVVRTAARVDSAITFLIESQASTRGLEMQVNVLQALQTGTSVRS